MLKRRLEIPVDARDRYDMRAACCIDCRDNRCKGPSMSAGMQGSPCLTMHDQVLRWCVNSLLSVGCSLALIRSATAFVIAALMVCIICFV